MYSIENYYRPERNGYAGNIYGYHYDGNGTYSSECPWNTTRLINTGLKNSHGGPHLVKARQDILFEDYF